MNHKKNRKKPLSSVTNVQRWQNIATEENVTEFLPCKTFDIIYGCLLQDIELEKHHCEKLLALDAARIGLKQDGAELIILRSGVDHLLNEMQVGEIFPPGFFRLYKKARPYHD